jgi:hypothetical protein
MHMEKNFSILCMEEQSGLFFNGHEGMFSPCSVTQGTEQTWLGDTEACDNEVHQGTCFDCWHMVG